MIKAILIRILTFFQEKKFAKRGVDVMLVNHSSVQPDEFQHVATLIGESYQV